MLRVSHKFHFLMYFHPAGYSLKLDHTSSSPTHGHQCPSVELWPGADSHVLSKELQQSLIPTLILALNSSIIQISSSSHPSMNLVAKGLDMFLSLQVGLELLDVLRRFVSRCEHADRDLDVGCIIRVNHGGVALCACCEGGRSRGGGKRDDLSPPAVSYHSPRLDAGVLGLHLFD